jgi:sugar (pentulose or hexulose) kinase
LKIHNQSLSALKFKLFGQPNSKNISMTASIHKNSLVIDIGKTHVKVHVLDKQFNSVFSRQMKNQPVNLGLYPSADVAKIWDWLTASIKEASSEYTEISALTITTHGATAALIDRDSDKDDGLVLPVLDYEYTELVEKSGAYNYVRPAFTDTFSPDLPVGLNLGRQLFWLKEAFPEQFAKTTDILMYPQYWAWRFTGTLLSEITSLGCHTDLWSVADNQYSSLVDLMECRDLLPEVKPAWADCGVVKPELANALGLSENCHFYNGIHDSNASFLRYRLAHEDKPFTVVSTGTWTIVMASQVALGNLDETRDMLANIDAMGEPIACARFMGGREFEEICEQAGSWLGEQFEETDIQAIIDQKVFALPDFSQGSGPFGGAKSQFVGSIDQVSGIALATIYCALMIDYQLEQLEAKGKVYIEGAFLKNPLLCAVLNQLRSEQDVYLSMDSTGTVQGAGYLTSWGQVECHIEASPTDTVNLTGLVEYRDAWRKQAEENK